MNRLLVRCSLCGRLIIGKHLTFPDGSVFCHKCMELPRCEACGKPSMELKDGLCPRCYEIFGKTKITKEEEKRCILCGKPVTSGVRLKEGWVCRECMSRLKRCKICGKILTDPERDICEECEAKIANEMPSVLVCALCGREIPPGPVWQWRDMYICPSCKRKAVTCEFCGRPMLPKDAIRKRGHILCPVCATTAITKVSELKSLVPPIMKILQKMGLEFPPIVVKLSTRKIMDSIGGRNPRRYGLFVARGKYREIHILKGLPRAIAIAVIAHELAHVWESTVLLNPVPKWLYEGFAEWIAYKVLLELGYKYDARGMLTKNDDYSTWLKKVLQIEKQNDEKFVISMMRSL